MGIKETIDSSFSFKKSARGIADVGRNYLSQAIEVISCCREIDIKNRPDLVPKRNEIYLAAHEALEAAKNNKKKTKLSPGEIDAAFKKVWELLKEPDLNLKVEEIQKKQDSARENDVKTQARLVPIMKQHEIKKAHPPGRDVRLKLLIGASVLTGPDSTEWIATDPFGNNQTLNIVLWLLIQSGKVTMDQNPHFYSEELLKSAPSSFNFKTDPLSFDKKLGTKDVRVLHVLVDESYRLVLQSQDLSFYRNFGNIWSIGQPSEPVRIVKHLNGTLEATNLIDSQISESRLALRPISGSASTPRAGENMWGNYLRSVSNDMIGQVTFEFEQLPAQLPTDNCEETPCEETEPEEQMQVAPQIQVTSQRQTRSQKAKEMHVVAMKADEQERAKENARLGEEAEKQEREARAAREARRRNEAERREREAQEKQRIEDLEQRTKAEQRAKAAQDRLDLEIRNREAEAAVWAEQERQEREESENRVREAEKVAQLERQKKPRKGLFLRAWDYVAGNK